MFASCESIFAPEPLRGICQIVEMGSHRIDKPEPRWQAILAFVAVAGIYLALPRSLIVGPTWLLPTLIGVLLVPTVVSHRLGKALA